MKEKFMMTLLLSLLVALFTTGAMLKSKEEPELSCIIRDNEVLEEPVVNEEVEEETKEELEYLGSFRLTGYCDCEICQEEWVGTTALGVAPTEEWTIAVDPDVIPLGSYVYIEGFDHVFRAEDVGAAIQENHIDVFVGSHEECYDELYNRYAEVYLVK